MQLWNWEKLQQGRTREASEERAARPGRQQKACSSPRDQRHPGLGFQALGKH